MVEDSLMLGEMVYRLPKAVGLRVLSPYDSLLAPKGLGLKCLRTKCAGLQGFGKICTFFLSDVHLVTRFLNRVVARISSSHC